MYSRFSCKKIQERLSTPVGNKHAISSSPVFSISNMNAVMNIFFLQLVWFHCLKEEEKKKLWPSTSIQHFDKDVHMNLDVTLLGLRDIIILQVFLL